MGTNLRKIGRLHELPIKLLSALLSSSPPSETAIKKVIDEDILTSIDWRSIAEDANSHAVGVLVYERLVDLELINFLPPAICRSWKADAQHAKLQHFLQRRDAVTISRHFSQNGLRHAFIKGFAYRDWLYHPAWVRIGGDADILIDWDNVELARRIMRDLDFTQAAYTPDHQHFRPATEEEIAQVEANHYELGEFTKDHLLMNAPEWLLDPAFVRRSPFAYGTTANKPVFHSSFDIHWAIHFMFAYASPLDCIMTFKSAGEEEFPKLSIEWNIIISSFKLYFEAFERPRYGFNHLVDLAALLDLADQVGWSELHNLVRQFRLEAAMFYTLSAAQSMSGKKQVPESLLVEWSQIIPKAEHSQAPHSLDFGNFVPYLIGRRIFSDFPIVG